MAKSAERRDRLAAALRANLKRRKAQARDRAKAESVSAAIDVPSAEAASLPHPRQNPAQKDE